MNKNSIQSSREIVEAMSSNDCYIVLTFDTDSDFFDNSLVEKGQDGRTMMHWRGIEEGVPLLLDILSDYSDSYGNILKATWFVRSDGQIEWYYNDPAFLLKNYSELWQIAINAGHEIAWHPHLYKMEQGRWVLETDGIGLKKQAEKTLHAIKQMGHSPFSCRIGEAYGSNELMCILDDLGLRCDSTAMPGRKRMDDNRILDWSRTSPKPYFPSRYDYQISGNENLRLLEIPMSMIETQAYYDPEPYLRYMDLSFHHEVVAKGFPNLLRNSKLIVTITHPSTILSNIVASPHGLLSFDTNTFNKNLNFIIEELTAIGRSFRFVTMQEYCILHNKGIV